MSTDAAGAIAWLDWSWFRSRDWLVRLKITWLAFRKNLSRAGRLGLRGGAALGQLWRAVWHQSSVNWLLTIIGLVAIGSGGWRGYQLWYVQPQYQYLPVDEQWSQYLRDLAALAEPTPTASVAARPIYVDIAGAVSKPGVYALSADARLQDAVLQAGGFVEQVDQAYIHHTLNLASGVRDQQKIYIPFNDEGFLWSSPNPDLGNIVEVLPMSGGSLPNLNTATLNELLTVKGVGEVRAEAIMQQRPYANWADLAAKVSLPSYVLENLQTSYVIYDN